MYPILQSGVKFALCSSEGKEPVYIAQNANGEEYEIDKRMYKLLINADGRRPLDLSGKEKKLIPVLAKYGLLQISRLQQYSGGLALFTVLPIGTVSEKNTKMCRLINFVLMKASAVVLTVGGCLRLLATFLGRPFDTGIVNLWVYYFGFIASIALHEGGHIVAGVSNGYRIRDAGILLFFFLPIGAYVQCDDEKKGASKAETIQYALAGVEFNMLIAGICLLASLFKSISMIMLLLAQLNIILAVSNMIPRDGLDGEKALSAMFEHSIGDLARKYLKSKKRRRKLLSSGPAGYACCMILLIAFYAKEILRAMFVLTAICSLLIAFN